MLKHKDSGERSLEGILALACIIAVFGAFIIGAFAAGVGAQPTGTNITYNFTDTPSPTAASSLTTAGGSFTTLVLNGSYQTPRWKAFVGNVTGILALDDSSGRTIYDWSLVVISGEVYVSRNSSITWSNVGCVSNSTILAEESLLNINDNGSDSINRTFNETVHASFYVGTTQITQSSCRAIATYVNDTKQAVSVNANFQEVLMEDTTTSTPVYATILEDAASGYNLDAFDFQIIVPEDETAVSPTPYYFYAEIS